MIKYKKSNVNQIFNLYQKLKNLKIDRSFGKLLSITFGFYANIISLRF